MAKKAAGRLKKGEKPGPSLPIVLVGGFAAMLVGIGFSLIYSAFLPVEAVRALPNEKQRKEGVTYILQGDVGGGSYTRQQRALTGEGAATVTLTEADLNRWSRSLLGIAAPRPDKEIETLKLTPRAPNFRIYDDKLQIAAPIRVEAAFLAELKPKGDEDAQRTQRELQKLSRRDVWLVATGTFNDAQPPRFVPDTIQVGAASVPSFTGGFLVGLMQSSLYSSEQLEEVREAWENVTSVTIEGDQLRIEKQ